MPCSTVCCRCDRNARSEVKKKHDDEIGVADSQPPSPGCCPPGSGLKKREYDYEIGVADPLIPNLRPLAAVPLDLNLKKRTRLRDRCCRFPAPDLRSQTPGLRNPMYNLSLRWSGTWKMEDDPNWMVKRQRNPPSVWFSDIEVDFFKHYFLAVYMYEFCVRLSMWVSMRFQIFHRDIQRFLTNYLPLGRLG